MYNAYRHIIYSSLKEKTCFFTSWNYLASLPPAVLWNFTVDGHRPLCLWWSGGGYTFLFTRRKEKKQPDPKRTQHSFLGDLNKFSLRFFGAFFWWGSEKKGRNSWFGLSNSVKSLKSLSVFDFYGGSSVARSFDPNIMKQVSIGFSKINCRCSEQDFREWPWKSSNILIQSIFFWNQ